MGNQRHHIESCPQVPVNVASDYDIGNEIIFDENNQPS